jgi:hypothetical protein
VRPPALLAATGLCVVASLACAASSPSGESRHRDVRLSGGSSTTVEGTSLAIAFEAVRNDSRCPVGARCIRAGDATVALRLEGGGADARTVELHTNDEPRQAGQGSYVVILVALAPEPVLGRNVTLADYEATLRVQDAD